MLKKSLLVATGISVYFISSLLCCFASAQSAKKVKTQEEEIREQMISISRQLNVTCNTCHNPENFKSDSKKEFKIALEHMKITQTLIDHGMDGTKGRNKADCYLCHRGKLQPDFKEKIDPMMKK